MSLLSLPVSREVRKELRRLGDVLGVHERVVAALLLRRALAERIEPLPGSGAGGTEE
jgi:hypothetical protein